MNKLRKRIIAGNWKMNKSVSESKDLASDIKRDLAECGDVDVVLCPPFTSLASVGEILVSWPSWRIALKGSEGSACPRGVTRTRVSRNWEHSGGVCEVDVRCRRAKHQIHRIRTGLLKCAKKWTNCASSWQDTARTTPC